MVVIPEDEYLASQGILVHYGTPRHSGRYPWGSGEDPVSQRNHTLLSTANELKAKGYSETQIASALNVTTTQLRDIRTVVRNERRQDEIHMATTLKEKGLSNGAIAVRMREAGFTVNGESQVRALLKPSQEVKSKILDNVTDTLRNAVDKKGYLDVGAGTEYQLNITSTKLRSVLQRLKDEGYAVHEVKVEQLGTGNQTNMRVLTKPGTTWGDAQKNRHLIEQLDEYSDDGGRTILNLVPPLSISSKRVGINYKEDGGAAADGVIYVRPGVKDVSLGSNRYAQVRIMVDGSHYLKGMAIYKDDLPAGVDLQFNTNKSSTGNKLDAMKQLKRVKDTGEVDQDNPFGASIRMQLGDRDTHGKLKLTSAMNIVNEEGKWDDWSRSLSSQFLSKQPPALAKEQLALTYTRKRTELDTIKQLTNPSVRRKLLDAYADSVDASAVHLKAAALPRQRTQVILPIKDIKQTEVYAPNFKTGDRVALVRFPHGGTFEIPELTVNNNNPAGKKLLGPGAKDAIGIHYKVAERLSGADFDGDSVLVIPNNLGKVRSTPALEGLKGFDAQSMYPSYPGMIPMTERQKGFEMGKISNLITDMTIQRASPDEIARAVRHSMVVIDAEKHKLDFRRSASANGIAALVKKYQPDSKSGGASTLVSRATSRQDVLERKLRSAAKGGPIDPATGKPVYEYTGREKTWTDSKGNQQSKPRTMQSTKLAEAEDAHSLSSGTLIESLYAGHSNSLKGLSNEARKELVTVKPERRNPTATKTYAAEVASLNHKLGVALKNAPLERQAQVFANATVRLRVQANPELKLADNKAELKRVKSQALAAARLRTGASKHTIEVTDGEWKAIQARAISPDKLDKILTYADLNRIKELASPRTTDAVRSADVVRARNLHARGYTWAEVAEAIGVSVTTIKKELNGEGD